MVDDDMAGRGCTGLSAGRVAVVGALTACLIMLLMGTSASAGSWLAPVDLSRPGQDALESWLTVDPRGDAVAVWTRSDGKNWIVQAATRPAGGTWQAPVNLSAPGQDASGVQVAIDSRGDAVAVWSRDTSSNVNRKPVIQAATLPAGASWQAPVDLSGTGAFEPQVSFDPQGNAVAVWNRYNGSEFTIQAATRPAGGSWQPAVDLSSPGQYASVPGVRFDAQGNALAIWSWSNGSSDIIQAATRPAGGSWQAPVDLSTPGQRAEAPQVAVDSHGNAVALWLRYKSTVPFGGCLAETVGGRAGCVIEAATRPAGGSWQAPVNLSNPAQDGEAADLAVDPQGNAVAIWQLSRDGSPADYIIQAASRRAGGSWQAPVQLSSPGQNASAPWVSLDPHGNAAAVWSRSNTQGDGIIEAATRPAGGRWQVPVDLTNPPHDGANPLVAVDSHGNAVALWSGSNNDPSSRANIVIQAALYEAAARAPRLTRVAQSHHIWREGTALPQVARRTPIGTTFSFRLDQTATVTFTFSRPVGHPSRRCRTHIGRTRRCRRGVTAGTLTLRGHAGTNRVFFAGRLSRGRKLPPGPYTLTLIAKSDGHASRPATLAFTIISG